MTEVPVIDVAVYAESDRLWRERLQHEAQRRYCLRQTDQPHTPLGAQLLGKLGDVLVTIGETLQRRYKSTGRYTSTGHYTPAEPL